MAEIVGSGGGFWDKPKKKTPPGLDLLEKEKSALARQAAGKNPQISPRDVADSLLGILGTNTHLVSYAVQHPLGRAEAKGPFTPAKNAEGLPVIGGAVPFFGGPGGILNKARRAEKVAAKAYKPRTLKVNDLEAQLPKARSHITNVGERLADRASAQLQKSERATKIPALRLATSGERVAKAAGRSQRIERTRADAAVAEHLNAIKHVKSGSPEDVAHFWYAQLPKTHRNAQGLSLIREKQAAELQYVTSGEALADLNVREAAVKAQMRSATSGKEALPLLKDLEEIKIQKSDLPQLADDTAASLAQLDKVIANPPPVNEKIINAVHALGNERQRILVDSGRLKPERAANRKGLVSGFVGLEPSGEEAYIGHRLPKPDSSGVVSVSSGGTGRVRSPQGVGTENKLILAANGRLRQSVHIAHEDYATAQVFHQANVARDDLSRLGSRFTGRVPEGSVLVNPRGVTVPPHMKTEELAQFRDGYEDIDNIREQAKQILDGFIATDASSFERMKQQALEQGMSYADLRVVPKRLVDRYYAQFRSFKGRSTPTKVYDALVDAVSTSIVFARLGYVPKNIAQNVIMAAPHQGAMLPINAVRAAQAMADPKLRHFLQAEVGHTGATGSLGNEAFSKKVLGRIASGVGKVADDPIRMSAFLHEAAAAGVISKVNPLLTAKDRAALLRLFTDKSKRPLLNDIRSRAVEAMADFSRMTPDQARLARRFLIIPGWLMAGTRYPFHFAATHPIRSALLAYISLGEPGAPDGYQFNKPVNEYFHGSGYRQRIDTPVGSFRTNSLSPVSTPYDITRSVVGTAKGKTGPFDFTTPTIFDEAQPLAAFGIRLSQGEGIGSATRLAPNYSLIRGLISPSESPTYPEDRTRLGRLKRELGVLPVQVNDPGSSSGGGSSFWDDSGSSGGSSNFWGK